MTTYGDAIQRAIAEQLRAERAIQGLTFDQLSERSGVPKPTLSRYLKGERDIPINILVTVAQAFGVRVTTLVDRAEARLAEQDRAQTDPKTLG